MQIKNKKTLVKTIVNFFQKKKIPIDQDWLSELSWERLYKIYDNHIFGHKKR